VKPRIKSAAEVLNRNRYFLKIESVSDSAKKGLTTTLWQLGRASALAQMVFEALRG
jgi:hypothetical protein